MKRSKWDKDTTIALRHGGYVLEDRDATRIVHALGCPCSFCGTSDRDVFHAPPEPLYLASRCERPAPSKRKPPKLKLLKGEG